MTVEVFDCEQGSPEWWACRLGIPTASEFSAVMAKGKDKKPDGSTSKTRRAYMLRLAGERITGEPAETYSNGHMERGKIMEAEARAHYALRNLDIDPRPVGFIRNGDRGCSPDSLLDIDGVLEIKTMLPHILIPVLLADEMPPEHKPQVQGQLWVSEREWADFVGYWPRMPQFIKRIYRDEAYIDLIAREVRAFNEELVEVEKRLRQMETGPTTLRDLRESATILAAG